MSFPHHRFFSSLTSNHDYIKFNFLAHHRFGADRMMHNGCNGSHPRYFTHKHHRFISFFHRHPRLIVMVGGNCIYLMITVGLITFSFTRQQFHSDLCHLFCVLMGKNEFVMMMITYLATNYSIIFCLHHQKLPGNNL